MTTIRVGDMVRNKVLVTRTSARDFGANVSDILVGQTEALTLDFGGIRGITPSFFDELLLSMGELAKSQGRDLSLRIVNPPSELSSIHEAIGRAHGLSISESESGSWLVERSRMLEDSGPNLRVQA